MAWQRRGSGLYFYRSVRRGGRVVKEYGGAGVIGQLAELAAEADRLERETQNQAEEEQLAAILDTCGPENPLAQFSAEASRLVSEALTSAGYYRHHRGEWRRRKVWA